MGTLRVTARARPAADLPARAPGCGGNLRFWRPPARPLSGPGRCLPSRPTPCDENPRAGPQSQWAMAPAHRPGASRRQTGQFRPWPPANTPRIVEFRDSLPMTATGKILKRELARQEQPEPAPHPVTIMMPNESVR